MMMHCTSNPNGDLDIYLHVHEELRLQAIASVDKVVLRNK